MNSCLEPARLLDFANGGADREAEAHLIGCSRCRADLLVMQLLPDAVSAKELVVPDELNEKTLARIRELARSEAQAPPLQAALTGLLGALTCFGALVVTGSAGAGGLPDMILFSAAVGIGFAVAAAWPRGTGPSDWLRHPATEA